MLFSQFLKNGKDIPSLKGANSNFKLLLDNLSTAVVLVDDELRLLHMNLAAETLLQMSLSHMFGSSIEGIYYESDDAFSKIKETLSEGSIYTKRRARWRLHTGKRITVDYTVTPIPETHQILFEIQPLDRLLQISREEAMIASQGTTRNLLRGLAHEVKNPLGGIRGAAQLLDREITQLNQLNDLHEYTQIIISEADRLRNLVDRMLGPRQKIHIQEVNIHEILERVITLITAETHGAITLLRNYDPSIPPIQGDSELLMQALLNVVRNATQALQSQTENEEPTIELATRIHRQFTIGRRHYPLVCCVSITDNGPGIPPEIIEDIFYPMISGRAEGTGLGLSISQQLINQHQGLIECTSEPGETRFSIYIPLG